MRDLGFELAGSSFVRRLGPVAHYVNIRPAGRPHHALVSLIVAIANPKVSDRDARDAVYASAYLAPDGVRFGTRTPWPADDVIGGHTAFAAYGLAHFTQLSELDQLREVLMAATAEQKLVERFLAGDEHGLAAPPVNRELLTIIESYAA